MSDLGTLVAAAAAQLEQTDSERFAVAARIAVSAVMKAYRTREFWWNTKQWNLTPLVADQYAYAQGSGGSNLPEDWEAPAEYMDQTGQPTAWITTTADEDTRYPFQFINKGIYWRRRQENNDTTGRPKYWTMDNEGILILPAADVTTYKIFGNYIYNPDQNFSYSISSAGAWDGSNDTYTSDLFDVEKGYFFLLEKVCANLRAGYLRDPANAQAHAAAANEQLAALHLKADRNVATGRLTKYW